MITFTTTLGIFIAVPILQNTCDHKLTRAFGTSVVTYKFISSNEHGIKHLSSGEYELIGLKSTIVNEERLARKIVEGFEFLKGTLYKDYVNQTNLPLPFKESFYSLCYLHEIFGEALIIKKLR